MPYTVRYSLAALLVVTAAACSSSDSVTNPTPGFLSGQVGVVVNSTGHALTLFQLGSPTTTRTVAFGTSSTITPVSFSLRGSRAAVPLGDAASVALVDLAADSVVRYFTFASGNATGSAWADDSTVIATNPNANLVGRFRVGQAGTAIATTVTVATYPTAVAVAGGRAFVVSGNLDINNQYASRGNGVVTAIDPATMAVVGTVQTGGTNPTSIAVGPDGKLYVVNTGDYVTPGSLTIINPSTLAVDATIPGMGAGPGGITFDAGGLAYISGYYFGTLVWNSNTRQFVRGPSNPVCAPLAGGGCRGAFGAAVASDGTLYQAFFGSAKQGLAPQAFVYTAGTFALRDSVAVGAGPADIQIRSF